jgi:hypothetical protein
MRSFHTTHRGHRKELVLTYHYTFRFEFFTVLAMWSSIFWDVMASSLMKIKQHSGGTYYLACSLQHAGFLLDILFHPEDELYGTISQKKESLY